MAAASTYCAYWMIAWWKYKQAPFTILVATAKNANQPPVRHTKSFPTTQKLSFLLPKQDNWNTGLGLRKSTSSVHASETGWRQLDHLALLISRSVQLTHNQFIQNTQKRAANVLFTTCSRPKWSRGGTLRAGSGCWIRKKAKKNQRGSYPSLS